MGMTMIACCYRIDALLIGFRISAKSRARWDHGPTAGSDINAIRDATMYMYDEKSTPASITSGKALSSSFLISDLWKLYPL